MYGPARKTISKENDLQGKRCARIKMFKEKYEQAKECGRKSMCKEKDAYGK